MMKRPSLVLVLVMAAHMSSSTVSLAGEVLDRIKSRGYITMNGVDDWPPFSSLDANGNYVGFDVDVADEVARRMAVEVKRIEDVVNWEQETAGDWNGKIDLSIGGMTPTAERGKNLDFPVIYTYAIVSLAVHEENTTIRTPNDASGRRIGVLKSATYERYLRREPFDIEGMPPISYKIDDPIVVTFEKQESETFEALKKGDGVEVDAIINYLPTLMTVVKEGMPFRIIGQPLYRVPQAVAIEPGDHELAEVLNTVVSQMHEDGTLTKLSMKWFEFDMTKP